VGHRFSTPDFDFGCFVKVFVEFWILQYELKLDGFRALGQKSGRSTQLCSRNHKDFTHRFECVANALLELPREIGIRL
jgi:ATP-dependent DNA ligase